MLNFEFYINQRVGLFVPDETRVNKRYLYHWLLQQSNNILYASTGSAAQPNLSSEKMMSFKIPLPAMEIQGEIARILDDFALLSSELSIELSIEFQARKKQYNFYRDQLLNNGNKCNVKRLYEIANIYDGIHQTPEYTNRGVPFISVENINDIYGSTKYISKEAFENYKIKPKENDIFMTRIGTVGKCAIVTKKNELAYYVSLALIRPNTEIIDSRYLKHYIESSLGRSELYKRTLHYAVPIKINKTDIGEIIIKYPNLIIQRKIVDVLDNFESICNDLNIGLPAEIEARKKQYEYYRDMLLTFA